MVKIDNEEREKRADIVNRDHSGVFPSFEIFYLHSILYSASRCLDSFKQYEYFKSQDTSPETLISIVQEAIGHSAALSRYFWPSPTGKKENKKEKKNQNKLKDKRGVKLRKYFNLTKESALYNRKLRNAWEHFDERLDSYLLEQVAGHFYPDCILDSHTLVNDSSSHIFKLLDVNAECLVLMNRKYFFRPIIIEVESIYEKTISALNNGGRLR